MLGSMCNKESLLDPSVFLGGGPTSDFLGLLGYLSEIRRRGAHDHVVFYVLDLVHWQPFWQSVAKESALHYPGVRCGLTSSACWMHVCDAQCMCWASINSNPTKSAPPIPPHPSPKLPPDNL